MEENTCLVQRGIQGPTKFQSHPWRKNASVFHKQLDMLFTKEFLCYLKKKTTNWKNGFPPNFSLSEQLLSQTNTNKNLSSLSSNPQKSETHPHIQAHTINTMGK